MLKKLLTWFLLGLVSSGIIIVLIISFAVPGAVDNRPIGPVETTQP